MKKFNSLSLFLCFALGGLASFDGAYAYGPKAIYDRDTRVEVRDYPDALIRDYGESVAGMVRNFRLLDRDPNARIPSYDDLNREIESMLSTSLTESEIERLSLGLKQYFEESLLERRELPLIEQLNDDYYYFDLGRTLRRNMNICPHERFSEQTILPDCTGFLIAPDVLITAGHCVETEFQCRNSSWVFGFKEGVERLPHRDVYRCQEIITQGFSLLSFITKDYAMLKLDRPVEGRRPLPIRTSGRARIGDPLAVIGHPSGLPLKVADEASVRRSRIAFFYTDLDTFQGNSGSPVINLDTSEVEGILVEGEEDYTFDSTRGCYVSRRFNAFERGNAMEKVFRINGVPGIQNVIDSGF